MTIVASLLLLLLFTTCCFYDDIIPTVSAHGYLKTPRSRNLVAYQDKNWETYLSGGGTSNDPSPEDCPHCLNRGGILAQCGISSGMTNGVPLLRNYDSPLNIEGKDMLPNVQGVYKEGSTIDINVLVTTHHKGHFEFAICPINDKGMPMEIPTQECFDQNKLQFVSDELYGAPYDSQYPYRGYLAPATFVEWTNGLPGEQPVTGSNYKMKYQLPKEISGNVVLLQWYWLTANSCKHEGYAEYPFPEEWGPEVFDDGLPDCENIPPDGDGVPEQFWNCAEIRIVGSGSSESIPELQEATLVMEEVDTVPPPFNSLSPPVPPPPSPTPPSINEPCSGNSLSSYYEATEDCTGYVYCMMGTPGEPYYCGEGMLYDQTAQQCDWAAQVTCAGIDTNGEPVPPTPPPTPKPNEMLDWDTAVDRGHDKTIIGYYASWQWYDRNGLAEPAAFDFSKMTRVNFAFFQITEEGYIYGTDNWADPITLFGYYDWMAPIGEGERYCSWDEPGVPPVCSAHHYDQGLIYLAHAAGAEVYPSIGGWSLSDPFPAMAANSNWRANFAKQCVELIKSYNFDGIDLDWEYPGYEPHSGTPDDTINFNLLLDDIRAALDDLEAETGRYYGITAALPCGPSIIAHQDIAHVGSVLTELNLMTYDFHGSWNDATGVNAPLHDQVGSPEFSVHGCVANWMAGGAPKEKINIGFPFYGRSFKNTINAETLYQSHEGADDSTWHEDEGVPQYFNIVEKGGELTSVRDERTMTQYVFGKAAVGLPSTLVSFDDERAICDKTEYAQVHGLNGYIIWEISGDLMPDLSTPLLDAANAKLLNPDLDCASLDKSDIIMKMSEEETEAALASLEVASLEVSTADVPSTFVHYPTPDVPSTEVHYPTPEVSTPVSTPDVPTTTVVYHSTPEVSVPDFVVAEASDVAATPAVSVFYPDPDSQTCLNDGLEPGWLQPSDIFSTAQACCDYHYSWNKDCLAISDPNISLGEKTFYPSTTTDVCLSDGSPPEWLGSESFYYNAEECCASHYGYSNTCVAKSLGSIDTISTASEVNSASNEISTSDTAVSVVSVASLTVVTDNDVNASIEVAVNDKFFPVFNGGRTICQSGTPPNYVESMLGDSMDQCCRRFAFKWDYEACLRGVTSDANAGLYYPKFRASSCVSHGLPPSWMGMAGDYLSANSWECCHKLFSGDLAECLEKSAAVPACDNCPPDMHSWYDSTSVQQTVVSGQTTSTSTSTASTTSTTSTSQTTTTTSSTTSSTTKTTSSKPMQDIIVSDTSPPSSGSAAAVKSVLLSNQDMIDSEILIYETPSMEWLPSSTYKSDDMIKALDIMATDGIAGKFIYMGDDSDKGHVYGLVNLAAFLAQAMKETIKYNACDENSWDFVAGGYPLSNSCGQLGQSYEDYHCSEEEKHMECPVKKDMEITATTGAKWWGAPAPLKCGPKEKYPFTGFWDNSMVCDDQWANPPKSCDVYEGQKGGGFNNNSPSPNTGGRTDIEGCCWWGRGVIQTTGVCNFGKLNYYLGAKAAEEGRESRYPDINFCEQPDAICASEEYKELKWIAGLFYWVESVQSYESNGWNYMDELHAYVDRGFEDTVHGHSFIDAVSGIVNRGCHNPPCQSGGVDGGAERALNFEKVLKSFDLV